MHGRDHLGDLGVEGRVILKLILNKCGMVVWTGFVRLRIDYNDGFL
jgi:hypothetical protein